MAQTVAECELGIPPAPHIRSAMKRRKVKRFRSTLISCASKEAQSAVTSTKFQLKAVCSNVISHILIFSVAEVRKPAWTKNLLPFPDSARQPKPLHYGALPDNAHCPVHTAKQTSSCHFLHRCPLVFPVLPL